MESHLNKQMIMSAKTFFSTLQVAVYKDSLKLFWILSLITNQLDICLRFAESGWPSVNFFSSSTSITLFFGILIARNTPKPNNQVSFRNHDIMWFQTRYHSIEIGLRNFTIHRLISTPIVLYIHPTCLSNPLYWGK